MRLVRLSRNVGKELTTNRCVIVQKSAVLTLGQVSLLIIFHTEDFAKNFGTSRLHLFQLLFYKILNLKDYVGGGDQAIC